MTPFLPKATIIDGKAFAARLRADIKRQLVVLKERHGLRPGLATVRVGDDPASEIYVRYKGNRAREAGMRSLQIHLPGSASQEQVIAKVDEINADPQVHGILVQLPLPEGVDPFAVIEAVRPAKDVDGFHPLNVGRLVTGQQGLAPCTPQGCLMLIEQTLGPLEGLRALVVGRSNIVGKPMASLLLAQHCTVTLAHSRSRDLAAECCRADILVVAVGRAEMVRGDWIKPGATVIDVGINRVPGPDGKTRLVGDVAFAEARAVAGAITPVPGGVGPMTIACLMRNTVIAACRQAGVALPEP